MPRTPFLPRRACRARRAPLSGLGLALLLALSSPLVAQGPAPAASGGPEFFADLLGGVDGWDPGVHMAGGLGAGYRLNHRAGVEGVAMAGGGGGYRSVHLAGGPSFRLVTSPRGELRSWAGVGWYRESLVGLPATLGVEPRSMVTLAGGLLGRIPAGRVRLTGGILVWHGSLDAEGFAQASGSTGVRLVVGVGR